MEQILTFFQFSASTEKGKLVWSYVIIIVWVYWYGYHSVLCMCVLKNLCLFKSDTAQKKNASKLMLLLIIDICNNKKKMLSI